MRRSNMLRAQDTAENIGHGLIQFELRRPMHVNGFIDLDRRFHPLTDSELEDAESLAAGSDYGSGIGWPKLLQYRRLILLAEAGAGKTAEMRQQAKRLAEEGKFAFFVDLADLDREPVEDVLPAGGKERLEEWKTDGKAPAWFFPRRRG